MGRRSEQHIAAFLPVRVHGFDSRRSPFTFTAETQEMSFSRARLRELNDLAVPGMKIEIECRGSEGVVPCSMGEQKGHFNLRTDRRPMSCAWEVHLGC
jgi:hypothetical protein